MTDTTCTQECACQVDPWQGFKSGVWQDTINVRDFIQQNYTPYTGEGNFLAGPTEDTIALWDEVKDLMKKEIDAGGLLDADTEVVSTIVSHAAGYIDQAREKIVGLQTDAPL
ncbi:MAG: pyruvate formate lyase family protein, partial [Akkermansia sp.]|nr:pyruvate formate lyase family protein [Akkermansia sp.]